MAKTYAYGKEAEIIADISSPEYLAPRVPRIGEVAEGAALMRNIHSEINALSKVRMSSGFDKNRHFQHVARVDEGIVQALQRLDPEIFKDKKRFFKWLNTAGKAWDVRGKVYL